MHFDTCEIRHYPFSECDRILFLAEENNWIKNKAIQYVAHRTLITEWYNNIFIPQPCNAYFSSESFLCSFTNDW